jgi:hypothetical protein
VPWIALFRNAIVENREGRIDDILRLMSLELAEYLDGTKP